MRTRRPPPCPPPEPPPPPPGCLDCASSDLLHSPGIGRLSHCCRAPLQQPPGHREAPRIRGDSGHASRSAERPLRPSRRIATTPLDGHSRPPRASAGVTYQGRASLRPGARRAASAGLGVELGVAAEDALLV